MASVIEGQSNGSILVDIPVVKEFLGFFPEDLLGLPLDWEIVFSIDLLPSTTPISNTPYRMALAKLKELKEQLQELLDKGYICPSVSPLGALMLLVEKER